MTLTITGTVENLVDVEALTSLIRDFKEDEKTNHLYWQGYPVLIAWENHVTGLFQLSEEGKAESLKECVDMVNKIMADGWTIPRVEREE